MYFVTNHKTSLHTILFFPLAFIGPNSRLLKPAVHLESLAAAASAERDIPDVSQNTIGGSTREFALHSHAKRNENETSSDSKGTRDPFRFRLGPVS